MFSQTFVGREIFAIVWGLGVLSAAAKENNALRFPFDAQLRCYAESHAESLSALWESIRRFAGLSEDIMRVALDEAPWTSEAIRYPDLDSIKMELVLSDSSPRRFVGTTAFHELLLNDDNVRSAYRSQMVRLLDVLLGAHWAFCLDHDAIAGHDVLTSTRDGMAQVFDQLGAIVDVSDSSGPLFDAVYRDWRASMAELSISACAVETYRSFLIDWIAVMDES